MSLISETFYRVLLFLTCPLWLALGAFLCLFSEKRRKTFLRRLGFQSLPDPPLPQDRPLWLHALSVGEVRSVRPLVTALRNAYPGLPLLISASTATGMDTARELYGQEASLAFFVYDFPPTVAMFLDRTRPRALVMIETDLWPNVTRACAKRGIPLALVNARMSSGSFETYRRLKALFGPTFRRLDLVTAPSEEQAARYRELGAAPDKVFVTGNIKYDAPLPGPAMDRAELSIARDAPVLVAGSTHPGEEEILGEVFSRLKERFPDLVLIVAPRDPKRAGKAAEIFRGLGQGAELYSRRKQGTPASLWVLDEMGVLGRLYSLCDAAFVGGSLSDDGGHNPLEPAAWGKPVLFGPHMEDFADMARLLTGRGAALQVSDANGLFAAFCDILGDSARAASMGETAARVMEENRGAAEKNLKRIFALLR